MIRWQTTSNKSGSTAIMICTTFMRIFRVCVKSTAVLWFCVCAAAQLKPPTDSWPTYHGDYSGQRHSPLTQITPENVSQLALAWAFQTGQSASIKATPIVVNGMLYVSAPDQLWA